MWNGFLPFGTVRYVSLCSNFGASRQLLTVGTVSSCLYIFPSSLLSNFQLGGTISRQSEAQTIMAIFLVCLRRREVKKGSPYRSQFLLERVDSF